MHAELFRRLALVSTVTRKHLQDVLLLELTHCVSIGNACTAHLEDEVGKFAFHSRSLPFLRDASGPKQKSAVNKLDHHTFLV